MSLNLYTSRKYIPKDMKMVESIFAYFDIYVTITECDIVKCVLEEIDHSKWYSTKVFTSRFVDSGNVSFSHLSNGGKTVLLTYYHPDKCITLRSCVDNAAKLILELDRGNVFLPYQMDMLGDYCDIILNGGERFYNIEELEAYLDDRPEIFDG